MLMKCCVHGRTTSYGHGPVSVYPTPAHIAMQEKRHLWLDRFGPKVPPPFVQRGWPGDQTHRIRYGQSNVHSRALRQFQGRCRQSSGCIGYGVLNENSESWGQNVDAQRSPSAGDSGMNVAQGPRWGHRRQEFAGSVTVCSTRPSPSASGGLAT